MRRRDFLKSSMGIGAAFAVSGLTPVLKHPLVRSDEQGSSLVVGESIPAAAFVHDSEMNQKSLLELVRQKSDAAVVVLYIYGGGAPGRADKLGGLWCPDSFEDSSIPRFLQEKYYGTDVQLLPVACAPVYSTHYYNMPDRVFLDEPDDSSTFKENAEKFIASTEAVVDAGIIPVPTFYDLRHRLLFNREREDLQPGEGYGEIYSWQGKFRRTGDEQKYGVPTIWLLSPDGKVLHEPFSGNYYHSDPFEIRYTLKDVDEAIRSFL